jgi:post-segregation antitoxin (ccd killing protein)
MAKMFGKAKVTVDGQLLLTAEDAKLNLGGNKRNVVKGNQVYGYAEETMEATVECNVFIDASLNLDTLNNTTDATIMFQCDSGQTYALAHAWLESPVEAAAANSGGKTALKFAAPSAEQV